MDKQQELEVKFYLPDLQKVQQALLAKSAQLVQPRVHEINLRFDTLDQRLEQNLQVLRLRKDTAIRLTYKGPGVERNGVLERTEIEFTAGDFDRAQAFLEALGFRIMMVYEKYRCVYDLDGVLITLDEMPYGNFVEVEGPDATSIQLVSRALELNWSARVRGSYTTLFQQLKHRLALDFRDLTFENFAGLQVSAEDLGVRHADG